jgi:precorrin-2 dehydrogenase/sirohydrochlorin ferrochelatase
MSYFPAFLKLDNQRILIVGGGNIASSKLVHLLDFTTNITIISPKINDNIKQMIQENNLEFKNRKYEDFDIDNFNIIIVAVDDISLQKKIFNQAKFLPNCLVNSVDSVDYCDFIFPSYIKKDNLTVAISTGGSSPAVAKYLRKYLEKMIPNSIGDFLREMKEYRKKIAKSKERMSFLDKKAQQYIQSWSK